MSKILIIGGGWAGCSAALAAAKQGAEVTLLEKTDLLLGAGNVGGIMRNNGRFTAAEENIAMGASELFEITDKYAVHKHVNFPGHDHASFYDVEKVEPAVRRLLEKSGVQVELCSRAVDVKWNREDGRCTVVEESGSKGAESMKTVEAVEVMKGGKPVWMEADGFVEATGSSGPMGNCMRYGNGCAMCIQRCPASGPRASLPARAGAEDLSARRQSGRPGAFSGSCKIEKKSLSRKLQKKLSRDGFAVLPLPAELIHKGKLAEKVCQQYALDEFAENLILLDAGEAKLMTSYFSLEQLRTIKGLERARFLDPYAGGQGNSVRYMSVAMREDTMRACGFSNLFVGGEKSGFFVGHTEAITTGSLAGFNAARQASGGSAALTDADAPGDSHRNLLVLPRSLAVGELLAYAQEALQEPDGVYHRFTFAGGEFFQRMRQLGLYQVRPGEIHRRVAEAGLKNIYNS